MRYKIYNYVIILIFIGLISGLSILALLTGKYLLSIAISLICILVHQIILTANLVVFDIKHSKQNENKNKLGGPSK